MRVRCFAPLLAVLAIFGVLCPSCASARFTGMGNKRAKERASRASSMPSEQDKNLMRMRAVRAIAEEMGPDADESVMMTRVDELTEELLRKEFADAYSAPPKYESVAGGDNPWENGTVVRVMARVVAFVLAMMTMYACKEQIMGRENSDGKKPRPSVTPPAKKDS
eukprot:jgi/Undpi1/13049/HiC_scaffold_8.g02712.m1